MAIVLPVVAWVQWKRAERALRQQRPLPFSIAIPVLVGTIVVIAAVLLVGELLA